MCGLRRIAWIIHGDVRWCSQSLVCSRSSEALRTRARTQTHKHTYRELMPSVSPLIVINGSSLKYKI